MAVQKMNFACLPVDGAGLNKIVIYRWSMGLKYLVPLLLNIEIKKYIDSKIVMWCYILFNNVKNFKNGRKIVLGIKCVFHFSV